MFQNTHPSTTDAYMLASTDAHTMDSNVQAIAIHGGSRKRKMTDDSAFVSSDEVTPPPLETLAQRRKLTMPRCIPGAAGGEEDYVQFLPLPEELNRQVLAGLSMLPGQGNAFALFKNLQQSTSSAAAGSPAFNFPGASDSPCSALSELQPGTPHDGFFSKALYPDFHIYPSSNDGASSSRERLDSTSTPALTTTSFGIFEPALGAQPQDAMCLDESTSTLSGNAEAGPSGHGPQCRSIPQLKVRYDNGTRSELWATCLDCGAASKVQESQPSQGMCYSP